MAETWTEFEQSLVSVYLRAEAIEHSETVDEPARPTMPVQPSRHPLMDFLGSDDGSVPASSYEALTEAYDYLEQAHRKLRHEHRRLLEQDTPMAQWIPVAMLAGALMWAGILWVMRRWM